MEQHIKRMKCNNSQSSFAAKKEKNEYEIKLKKK